MEKNIHTVGIFAKALAMVWFITFIVEWHIRTEWKQHWLDGAIRAWANFSMLEWFNTEIAAGILALFAASAVLVSASLDRKHFWKLELIRKQGAIFEDIERLQLQLRNLAHAILTGVSEPEQADIAKSIEASCLKITSDVRPVAHLVMFTMARLREIKRSKAAPGASPPSKELATLLGATILSLECSDRLFELGTGRFTQTIYTIPPDTRRQWDFATLTEADRARFRGWIDWES